MVLFPTRLHYLLVTCPPPYPFHQCCPQLCCSAFALLGVPRPFLASSWLHFRLQATHCDDALPNEASLPSGHAHEPNRSMPPNALLLLLQCLPLFIAHAPLWLDCSVRRPRPFPCFLGPSQAAGHTQRRCLSRRGLTTYSSSLHLRLKATHSDGALPNEARLLTGHLPAAPTTLLLRFHRTRSTLAVPNEARLPNGHAHEPNRSMPPNALLLLLQCLPPSSHAPLWLLRSCVSSRASLSSI
jgi:hypothetical protein